MFTTLAPIMEDADGGRRGVPRLGSHDEAWSEVTAIFRHYAGVLGSGASVTGLTSGAFQSFARRCRIVHTRDRYMLPSAVRATRGVVCAIACALLSTAAYVVLAGCGHHFHCCVTLWGAHEWANLVAATVPGGTRTQFCITHVMMVMAGATDGCWCGVCVSPGHCTPVVGQVCNSSCTTSHSSCCCNPNGRWTSTNAGAGPGQDDDGACTASGRAIRGAGVDAEATADRGSRPRVPGRSAATCLAPLVRVVCRYCVL